MKILCQTPFSDVTIYESTVDNQFVKIVGSLYNILVGNRDLWHRASMRKVNLHVPSRKIINRSPVLATLLKPLAYLNLISYGSLRPSVSMCCEII